MTKREKLKDLIKRLLREKKTVGLSEYQRKRLAFAELCRAGYQPSAGEIANLLDGLTADGFDRLGCKVSFVERGESVFAAGTLENFRIVTDNND
jgi:hypothetical protein